MTFAGLAPFYLYTKSFHVISVIAWMAGLFYLPRLYVYHAQVARGSEESERFKVMERRLLKQITTPAMAVTWTDRVCCWCSRPVRWIGARTWWHVKLTCGHPDERLSRRYVSKWRRDFLEDRNMSVRSASTGSPMKCRRFSWSIIVIMAIAQPG